MVFWNTDRYEDNIKIVGDISSNVNWIKLAQDSLSGVECLGFITKEIYVFDIINPSHVTKILKIPKYCFFSFSQNFDFFFNMFSQVR
jgi:hypothetical protein